VLFTFAVVVVDVFGRKRQKVCAVVKKNSSEVFCKGFLRAASR